MRSRCALLSVLVSVALAMPAAAQTATPIAGDIRIGPYRFGMTADEVMAANPDAAWTIERYETSGEVFRLDANPGLSFAGQDFEAIVLPGHYGGFTLAFASRTMLDDIDMDTCEANVVAVVAELERIVGPFSPSSSFAVPVGGGVIAAGERSTLTADRDRVNALWDTVRMTPHPYDFHDVAVHGHYNGRPGEVEGCFIDARVTREAPPDQDFIVPYAELRFLKTPPIGVLHHSLDGVDLSAGDIDVMVRCQVSREIGMVYECGPAPGADGAAPERRLTPAERAAEMRARSMVADPATLDFAAPIVVQVDMPFRLSAVDRRSTGAPANVRPVAQVRWTEAPQAHEIEVVVMRGDGALRPFGLTLTCQIQPDLSLICPQVATSTGEPVPADMNPLALIGDYEAAPVLKDGSPAAGAWVSIAYPQPAP